MTRRRGHGFTLIEMLVAVVILLIFLGAIYGVYSAAQAAMAQTEEQAEVTQTGRALLAQLSAEMTSAYPTPGAETTGFTGEETAATTDRQEDTLTFLTTAHDTAEKPPAGDLCQVRYRMDDPAANETPGLYVELRRTPGLEMEEAEPEVELLSPRVTSFNVLYLPADGDWLTEWPDGPTLPVAVRVELAVQSDRLGAKPMTVTITTNVAMATTPAATTVGGANENAGAGANPGGGAAPGAGGGGNANP